MRPPIRVELIKQEESLNYWRWSVDRIKDISVVVAAMLAVLSIVPDHVRDPVLVWYGNLSETREDSAPIHVEQVTATPTGIEDWIYSGNGSGATPWIFGEQITASDIGSSLKPIVSVNLREAKVTGSTPDPAVLTVINASRDECFTPRSVDTNERTGSVWAFG